MAVNAAHFPPGVEPSNPFACCPRRQKFYFEYTVSVYCGLCLPLPNRKLDLFLWKMYAVYEISCTGNDFNYFSSVCIEIYIMNLI